VARTARHDEPHLIERGFTVVALLMVTVVVAVVAAIGVFAFAKVKTAAECPTEKSTIATALDTYQDVTGHYPASMDLLDGVSAAPASVGTLLKSVPADYTTTGGGNIVPVRGNSDGCR
jgi:hypothetical protein